MSEHTTDRSMHRTVARFVIHSICLLLVVALLGCRADSTPTPTTAVSTSTPPPAATDPTDTPETTSSTATTAPADTATSVPPSPTVVPATEPPPTVTVATAQLEGEALVEALRNGGYVLYFRHAATDFSQQDTEQENLENCETQRNLTDEGRAQAQAVGDAMRALDLPIDEVLASEYCRTRETAELAFEQVTLSRDITGLGGVDEDERARRVEALRTLLATPPEAGTNRVLVAHLFNIEDAADVSLSEGQAGIFAPQGDTFVLVARVTPEEWTSLAEQFASAEAAEPVEPTLVEFDVPAGSHPHDVAPDPDGSIVWYTAQHSGELGRLDPTTGETQHIPLGAGSAPHGVIVGPDDAPWITDGGLNAIVRVDPETDAVESFPLPADTGDTNLNTATFDANGVLWFTGQSGIYGRLDPDTGEVEVFDAPRGRGPYGIATTPDGDVYYASLAGSYVGRIDTATGEVTVLDPPTSGQGARRVWSDSEGRIWVSEWNAGQLARYAPETEEWREWSLPGTEPKPYAVYVDERDVVWLSDFGANALVRFQPSTEQFDVFTLPSANANVRQILGRPGEVWGAESGTDKLVVIRTGAESQ